MTAITEFLRQQKKAASPERRAQRLKKWLAVLDGFYGEVRSWLDEARQEKLIKVTAGEVTITEEALGTYRAPSLTLAVEKKTVKLKPIGSVIIGADGRVDMESSSGTYLFLYLADQKKWVHGFGKNPAEFPELTEKLFTDLLKRALA